MFVLFAFLFRSTRAIPSNGRTVASPASALMESAGSRAGQDPRHAQELRSAAAAWLSVVR
jgi:hypothetical protein